MHGITHQAKWAGVRSGDHPLPVRSEPDRMMVMMMSRQDAKQGSYLVLGAMSSSRQKRPGGRRLLSGHMAVWGLLHRNSDKTRPKPGPTMSRPRH